MTRVVVVFVYVFLKIRDPITRQQPTTRNIRLCLEWSRRVLSLSPLPTQLLTSITRDKYYKPHNWTKTVSHRPLLVEVVVVVVVAVVTQ